MQLQDSSAPRSHRPVVASTDVLYRTVLYSISVPDSGEHPECDATTHRLPLVVRVRGIVSRDMNQPILKPIVPSTTNAPNNPHLPLSSYE